MPRLLEIIATLERVGGGISEPWDVRYYLAMSYCELGFIELAKINTKLGPLNYYLIVKDGLAGKPRDQPEVEAILARIDKSLELLDSNPPGNSFEKERHRALELLARQGKALALVQLGRFTEALMDCDRALPLAHGLDNAWVQIYQLIFLKAAETEQSHMPWSRPKHTDHDRAIRMADYLAGQPQVSTAAIFNAACAFSLASLDDRADAREKARRADRAMTFLTLIEGKAYFQGSKQAKELREDKDLNPLRSRGDFQALAAKVASSKEQ